MKSQANHPPAAPACKPHPSTDATAGANRMVEILRNEKILTPKQVEYARSIQAKLENSRPLLGVLKELKFINDEQVKKVIAKNGIKVSLVDLLMALEHITDRGERTDTKNG